MILTTLYKKDTKNKIRQWTIEVDEPKYRVTAGLKDGKKVTSIWTIATPKNEGKSNATTSHEQALLEAEAIVVKQKKKNYVDSLKDVKELSEQTFKSPMLAKNYKDYKDKIKFPVYSDTKFDGIRDTISLKDGMKSREGNPCISCPHIFEELKDFLIILDKMGARTDGELYNHELKFDFNRIVELVKKEKPTKADLEESRGLIQYYLYDIDVPNLTQKQRVEFLEKYIGKFKYTKIVPHILCANQIELDNCYEDYLEDGYEGQIIRDPNSLYENKRTKALLKRKEHFDGEYKVVDMTEGKGNGSGMCGRVFLEGPNGEPFKSRPKGNRKFLTDLLKNKKSIIGKKATVRYNNLTPDGVPRFGRVTAIRDYE